MAHEKRCECGRRSASFHYRDNMLTEGVVARLYCPSCSAGVELDPASSIADNGWVIVYDMDAARLLAKGGLRDALSPSTLFDEGYCTWHGIYPGDQRDSVRERTDIVALASVDPREYVDRLRSWATERATRLSNEGWRKAKTAAEG